jgi:hypothetical protein
MPAPDSAIVRIMIAASVMPRPEPPYSSGMQMPSQPASREPRQAQRRPRPASDEPARNYAARLIETADVFIHSMRSKAIAKLGFELRRGRRDQPGDRLHQLLRL